MIKKKHEAQSVDGESARPNEEIAAMKDRMLRALAEAENVKRRAELDAKSMVDYSVSKFARDMLPLSDNLALALKSIEGKVDEGVMAGLKSISEQFSDALRKNGICRIKTIGEKLNPAEHMAVCKVECGLPEGIIADELQSGYKLGDKVLREAMVAVSKGAASEGGKPGEAEPKEAESGKDKSGGAADGEKL